MAASTYERQVAIQLFLAEGVLILREFGSGGFPRPRQVLGAGMVFGVLSLAQVGGPNVARLASLGGWLIVLGLGVSAVGKNPNLFAAIGQTGGGTKPLFPNDAASTASEAVQYTGGAAPGSGGTLV